MKLFTLLCSLALFTALLPARARETDTTGRRTTYGIKYPHQHSFMATNLQRAYWAAGADGAILSFSHVKESGAEWSSIPRFTVFFNVGSTVNYNIDDHFGIFSGFNIKNIGLIRRRDSVKLKERVYTFGVPLGFKAGDLQNRVFLFFGGQYDLAFNYKQKLFVNGDKREKSSEWFSNRTPLLMPSVFAGFEMGDFSFKLQYYPQNFFNPAFSQQKNNTVLYPYQSLRANVFFITFGYNFSGKDTSR